MILKLSDVGVFYSRRSGVIKRNVFWALKNISLELHKGETLGIIGDNGAGKSTLLKVLAGIIAPSTGSYHNNGCSISMLSLSVGFAGHLTGKENAILSGMLLGLDKKQIISKLKSIEEFSELASFFDQPVKTYSRGMVARLGFSVAFQADPDILLIDEVLGVGDEAFKEKSSGALRTRITSNKTVVLVSHSINTINNLCDRAILINKGKLIYQGIPSEVIKYYRELNSAKGKN